MSAKSKPDLKIYIVQAGAHTVEAAHPESAVAAAARLVHMTPDTQVRVLRELRERGVAAYTYGFAEVEIARVQEVTDEG